MLELNRLYNLDCMQGMKEFPDGFFDLAIVDPPYGIGIDGQRKRVCRNPKHNRKEHSREGWDNKPPTEEYFRNNAVLTKGGKTMQKKTVYLAGKITGDPFYRSKFYEAQKKLEEGGFIVVNPALLPSEGFTWEAYMRMAGAMLNECAEVCFLPDWTESRGAKYEFGEAVAQKKPFFFFNDWEAKQNAEK